MAKVTGVSFPLLALCLLIGVPLSRAQSQQCSTKIMECSQIVSIIFASSSEWTTTGNKAAMDLACNNATLKTCLMQAQGVCDTAMFTSFKNSIDQYCSPSGQGACQLEMIRCQAPIASAGNAANPMEICPLYQQALNCLNSVTQCQSLFIQMNVTQSISAGVHMCSMTQGVCLESAQCIQGNSGLTNPSDCNLVLTDDWLIDSGMAKLIQCLGSKNDVCKYPPGRTTFENVYTATMAMCSDMDKHPTNRPDCADVQTCQTSSPILSSLLSTMTKPSDQAKAIALLGNATFLCKMVEMTGGCYVQSAKACGYTPGFVTAMTSRHHSIMATCAGQSTDQPGGGSIQWTTSAIFMLLTALCGFLLVF